MKIMKIPVKTSVLILSLTCQLKLRSRMHPLPCKSNIMQMLNMQKFLSDNITVVPNMSDSDVIFCKQLLNKN